jgi:hypothetical protein
MVCTGRQKATPGRSSNLALPATLSAVVQLNRCLLSPDGRLALCAMRVDGCH